MWFKNDFNSAKDEAISFKLVIFDVIHRCFKKQGEENVSLAVHCRHRIVTGW